MTKIALAMLVLRTRSMEAARAFYQAIGLTMAEEKHGSGPVHYSSQVGETLIEIYPGADHEVLESQSGGATMLGFHVHSLDSVLTAVEQTGAKLLKPPKTTPWGRRAIVQDPDGRAVELNER